MAPESVWEGGTARECGDALKKLEENGVEKVKEMTLKNPSDLKMTAERGMKMQRETKNMKHYLVVDQVKRKKKMRVEKGLKMPGGQRGGRQGGGR